MIKRLVATPETLNLVLETWYIQNTLFDGIPYSIGFDGSISNSTLVYVELRSINLDYIRHLKALGNKVVLYHLGDERADADISAYPECDLVIRNYYFREIFERPEFAGKLLWAPNGFRTGVGPRSPDSIKKASERTCFSMFAGWLSNSVSYGNERTLFANVTDRCAGNLFCQPSQGFSGGYNVGLYSAMMEDSIFAPCPAGNSPETIRLYDALEVGSIPISLSHAFLTSKQALAALGPVPFPLIESWEMLPDLLSSMKANFARNPGEMNTLQAKCIAWWQNYKAFTRQKISAGCDALEPKKSGFSLFSRARRPAQQ